MTTTDPLRRPTKRQRLEQPVCWMDCESVDTVVALVGSGNRHDKDQQQQLLLIQTPLASQLTSEIFLDRLQKEILTPFRFSLSSQIQLLEYDGKDDTVHAAKERRRALQSRLCIGLNACIRALEEACRYSTNSSAGTGDSQPPTLLVLTNDAAGINNNNSNTALHVLVALAHRTRTPLLRLPLSSKELGQCLGTKHVTALTFLPPSRCGKVAVSVEHQQLHAAVDSFVDFMRDKVPTTSK